MPSNEPIPGKCGARSRDGRFCTQPAMTNGRCRMHGGKSLPAGPDHPTYKHGRRSRCRLPDRLAERIEANLADPELLSLRWELALLDVRIVDLVSEAYAEDSDVDDAEHWGRIVGLMEQRRKLVESERRAEQQAGQMVSVAEVTLLIGRFVQQVLDVVDDADKVAKIKALLARVMHHDGAAGRRHQSDACSME